MDGAIPARSVRDSAERRTLIRPPLVNRESTPVAGFVPRERARRSGSRGAADFISKVASDPVVCTKHLLRLERVTTMRSSSPARRAAMPPRPRNPSVPSCRPTQSDGLWPRGQSQLARSSGEGQPTAQSSQRRAIRCSSEHGSPINAQDSGTCAPRCSSAVGAARVFGASTRARSHAGSS